MRQPHLKLYYDVRIDGKIVIRRHVSRSWVKAFVQFLAIQFMAQSLSVKNTSAVSNSFSTDANNLVATGALDTSTTGIRVGSGTTAVTPSDYQLATAIVTGSSTGQLRHLAQTYNNFVTDSTGNQFQLIRPFVNNSGASVSVNEIGIYCKGNAGSDTDCIVRDVLGSTVTINAGQTLTVTYTIRANI